MLLMARETNALDNILCRFNDRRSVLIGVSLSADMIRFDALWCCEAHRWLRDQVVPVPGVGAHFHTMLDEISRR